MDEMRAVAELPHLNVEITRRRAPADDADELQISVRAAPSFAAVGDYLRGPAMWPMLALTPFMLWQQAMSRAFMPWLPVPRQLTSERQREAPEPPANVHPFPGSR